MNRRRFLKWLGVGSAAVVVAPIAIAAAEPSMSGGFHYDVVKADAFHCTCSARSFWEGRCDYCMAHLGTEEPIKSYADYSNFSDMQLNAALDDIISNTAKELGEAAGRDIAALQAKAFA